MSNQHRTTDRTAPSILELYNKLPEEIGCEVIANQLIMSPSPSREHQFLLIKLTTLLFNVLENNHKGTLLSVPFDVYFEQQQSIVQPDLFVVLETEQQIIKKNGVYGVPSLIIEIISTNRSYDTQRKKALYEKAGVKEYFMVDPENKTTTLLTLNTDGVYEQTYEETGVFNSGLLSCKFSF
ncbi:MAG: Uma2 family endonuclease [Mucilaginibacter sp.]